MTTFLATISIVNIVLGYLLAKSLHKGQAPCVLGELQQDAFFEQDSLLAEDPSEMLDADPALTDIATVDIATVDIATVDIEAQPNSLEEESDDQNEVLEEVDSQQDSAIEQPVDTNPRPEIIAEGSEEAEAVEELLAESVEEQVDTAVEEPSELPVEEETLQELEELSEQLSEQTGDSAQHATAPNEHNSSEEEPSEAASKGELMAGVEAFREQLAKMKE